MNNARSNTALVGYMKLPFMVPQNAACMSEQALPTNSETKSPFVCAIPQAATLT